MLRFCIPITILMVAMLQAKCYPQLPFPFVQGPDCPMEPVEESTFSMGAGDFSLAVYGCGGKIPTTEARWSGGTAGNYNAGSVTLSDTNGMVNIIGSATASAPVFFDGMLSYNPSVSAITLANATEEPGYWWSYGVTAQHGAKIGFTPPPSTDTWVLQSIASAQSLGLEDGPFGSWVHARAGNTTVGVVPGSSFYSRTYLDVNNNFSQEIEFGTGLTGHTVFGDEYVFPRGPGVPALDSTGNELDVIALISAGLLGWNGGHTFEATAMCNAVIRSFDAPNNGGGAGGASGGGGWGFEN